jgi:16S rRNA (guanine527-N7)-methyltransferase
LADSQGKKASFLREAVRVLDLKASVWPNRVEDLPSSSLFDAVTMRAVDRTREMLHVAEACVAPGGSLVRFLGETDTVGSAGWFVANEAALPGSSGRVVQIARA